MDFRKLWLVGFPVVSKCSSSLLQSIVVISGEDVCCSVVFDTLVDVSVLYGLSC